MAQGKGSRSYPVPRTNKLDVPLAERPQPAAAEVFVTWAVLDGVRELAWDRHILVTSRILSAPLDRITFAQLVELVLSIRDVLYVVLDRVRLRFLGRSQCPDLSLDAILEPVEIHFREFALADCYEGS